MALSDFIVCWTFSVQLRKLRSMSGVVLKDVFLCRYSVNSLNSCLCLSGFKSSVLQLLSLTVGFVCILSFGSFSSCKVHSFMIVLQWLSRLFVKVSCVFSWRNGNVMLLSAWKTNCWSVFDMLCFITVSCCFVCTHVSFAFHPAEMPGWSLLLVQCATYCKLRGKVHVHVSLCVCLFV